jgi:ribosomal protein L10
MNKSSLKKQIESNILGSLILNCHFIGFFCIQNMSVIEKIQLKKKLNEQGFKYILIKNTAFYNSFIRSMEFPSIDHIAFGSLAVFYSENYDYKGVNFISLKNVFAIFKREKNIYFIGGIYEGSFINCLFEKKLSSLKNLKIISIEYISLIQSSLTNIIQTTARPKNQLSSLLNRNSK